MSETDWEELYQQGDTHWDKGEGSPGLVDFLADRSELPRGSVLVPGCGTGHDARLWSKRGFRTVGLDIAPSAVRLATEKTEAAGLTAEFRLGDFLSDEPFERFDRLFEHTLYCAIHPSRRGDYFEAARRWLRPGGDFIAVHYLIPDEDGPPFGTTREEVVKRFSPGFELLKEWTPRSWDHRQDLELMLHWRRK